MATIGGIDTVIKQLEKEIKLEGFRFQVIRNAATVDARDSYQIVFDSEIELNRFDSDNMAKALIQNVYSKIEKAVLSSEFAQVKLSELGDEIKEYKEEIDSLNSKIKYLERYKSHYNIEMNLRHGEQRLQLETHQG